MNDNKNVKKIVSILLTNEEDLSDGYGYYCESVEKTLTLIANRILKELTASQPAVTPDKGKLGDTATQVYSGEDICPVCGQVKR